MSDDRRIPYVARASLAAIPASAVRAVDYRRILATTDRAAGRPDLDRVAAVLAGRFSTGAPVGYDRLAATLGLTHSPTRALQRIGIAALRQEGIAPTLRDAGMLRYDRLWCVLYGDRA